MTTNGFSFSGKRPQDMWPLAAFRAARISDHNDLPKYAGICYGMGSDARPVLKDTMDNRTGLAVEHV